MTLAREILGAWRVGRWRQHWPDGSITEPFGTDPFGLAIFDASGYMSAQIMLPPPASYVAYCGRFDIDEARGTLTTHVEASVSPQMRGSDQVRKVTMQGDRMTLRPPARADGGQSVIEWERVAPPPR